MSSRYFYAVVSMHELISWDETQSCARPNAFLARILSIFHLKLDLLSLHDYYFESVRVGQGDVFVYRNKATSPDLVAFDLYKEPSDQLDLISMAVVCRPELANEARDNIRSFYDAADCKLCLEESNISGKVIEMIAESNYPKEFPNSNYRQKLRTHLAEPSSI